ncbi:MAG: hypothetical protein PWR27_181 [Petroclostridium sp.]|jgi:Tfp pilus assembly protein PilO|uniref:DUF4830 domain-containing protein n=1 Tax=Petroclostridium xylanilyticum TaxID=1792311 RepID=UPI000B98DE2D|nr:DUF4830 domain-containing protein [Petroclostridium xylanilyticum]MBZ4645313.1 hypothetical protein [Clostridia bacterium]MDK2809472.1 hypothetical protein [Petroclostridium sp.]
MFIVSFKLNRKKLAIVILIIVLLIVLAVSILVKTREAGILNTLQKEITYNFSNIKTNEDRINFLKQFGWEIEEKPIEIMELQIPKEFDQVYSNYNEIQKEIGLDLEKYKGKRVKRYTYKVLNHPTNKNDEVRANILVYKDRVVAGDIMTTSIHGFMHSLLYKVNN